MTVIPNELNCIVADDLSAIQPGADDQCLAERIGVCFVGFALGARARSAKLFEGIDAVLTVIPADTQLFFGFVSSDIGWA